MKKIILSFSLLAFATLGKAQADCDILSHYGSFIATSTFNHNGQSYLNTKTVALPVDHCLAPTINPNLKYIDYLITNYSDGASYQELAAIEDSLTLHKEYISLLQQDSSFNQVMTEFIRGVKDKNAKTAYSTDNILNIAIKYFSITGLRGNNYMAKVCAGINDIKKTEFNRKPQLEAFCFSAILEAMQPAGNGELMKDFTTRVRELYKMNLGVDREERLLRAQGAVFISMRNSPVLKKLLEEAYEIKKESLPFVWTAE